MADDAPTAPGAAGLRHTAASRRRGLTLARFSGVVTRSTTTSHLTLEAGVSDRVGSGWDVELGRGVAHVSRALARGVQA
jgi:hypothetical protein